MRYRSSLLLVFTLTLLLLCGILLGCGGGDYDARFLESEKRLEGMYEECQTIEITDPGEEHPPIDVQELKNLERVDVDTLLKRANGMEVPGTWGGPSLSEVLRRQGVEGEFEELKMNAWDGYVARVGYDVAMRPDTILAYLENGEPLIEEDGPVRLVVGSEDGYYWIRMITEIEVSR